MSTEQQTRFPAFCIPRLNLLWTVLLVTGAIVWLFSFQFAGPERAWLALLASFLYFGPLSAGLVVWLAIIAVSRGKWAKGYEHLAAGGAVLAWPSILALLALWFGSSQWSPWLGKSLTQGAWLDTAFVLGRDLAALALFWLFGWFYLRRRQAGKKGGKTGAFFVLAYGVLFSLIGFDLGMALDPSWHSSLFGGYFCISGLYLSIAAFAFMTVWQAKPNPTFLHDLGKMLLAFSLLTTYLMFSQLLPIWYENLPAETSYVYARLNVRPATLQSPVLLLTIYLGPLVLLLTVWAKKNRFYLGAASGLIMLCMWLERWWLVLPSLQPGSSPGFADIGIALVFVGLWGLLAGSAPSWLPAARPPRFRRRS